MLVSAHHPFSWRTGNLNTILKGVFSANLPHTVVRNQNGFYPTDESIISIPAWFAVVKTGPRQTRVIVATGFEFRLIRMITLDLALASIEETGKAFPEDEATLNHLTQDIRV